MCLLAMDFFLHFCNNTVEPYFLELSKKLKEFSVNYSGYL